MKKLILFICACLSVLNVQAQNVFIPDANFKSALVADKKININNDTEIQVSEATSFTGEIYVYGNQIKSLVGIEIFKKITSLNCEFNQIQNLNLSENPALTKVSCYSNSIINMNLRKNLALTNLNCGTNLLTTIDVSKNTALVSFVCTSNKLTSLNVSSNTALTELYCSTNPIQLLNVSSNIALTHLSCGYNQLTTLDINKNFNLKTVYCDGNKLDVLDVSKNLALATLKCHNNNLSQICINTEQIGVIEKNSTLGLLLSWKKDASAIWSVNCVTGIEDEFLEFANKKIIKIFSPLGQEVKPEQAFQGMFLYQYNDGSTKKVLKE